MRTLANLNSDRKQGKNSDAWNLEPFTEII